MRLHESVPEKSTIETFMPQIFWELSDQIEQDGVVELNEGGRRLILEWIYSSFLDEGAVWHDSHNGFSSLDKTMRQVNNVAQDAGVNKHNREHIDLTMANSIFLCWVDFIQANKEKQPVDWDMTQLLRDNLQHATAALLHDVGYLGSLPRASADFGYFLKSADKKQFDNHPKVSAARAKETLAWMAKGRGERILSVLNSEVIRLIDAQPVNLWPSREEKQKWCDEICVAIGDHGTAQIVAGENREERSSLSKNLMFADKIHVEERLNFSNSILREDAQQNVYPLHAKGNPEVLPEREDIFNASHTRVTEAVTATRCKLDLIYKKVNWELEYNPTRVEALAKKHEVELGYTYDSRAFLSDFKRAHGEFNEKLKKILGDWDVVIIPVNYSDNETGQ